MVIATVTACVSCASNTKPLPAAIPASLGDGTAIDAGEYRFYKLNGQWYYRCHGGEVPTPTRIGGTPDPDCSVTCYEDNNGNLWNPAEVRYSANGNRAEIYMSGESRHECVITSSAVEDKDGGGSYIYSTSPAKLQLFRADGNRYCFAANAVSGSPAMPAPPSAVNTITIETGGE